MLAQNIAFGHLRIVLVGELDPGGIEALGEHEKALSEGSFMMSSGRTSGCTSERGVIAAASRMLE